LELHNWILRIFISLVVFLLVSALVIPHLMDVHPPLFVEVLLWPMAVMGPVIGKVLPHPNIGTAEHPVYEGTPIDLLVAFALAGFSLLLYPVATFFLLTLLAKLAKRNAPARE